MGCLAATSGDICAEIKLANIKNDSIAETNENTHTPQLKQRNVVESQASSIKETSLQIPEQVWNSSKKMKLTANKYCAAITPRTVKTKPKKRLTASELKCNGNDNISLLTKTSAPLFRKKTSPDCLKIRKTCIETLDFLISIHILLLSSYFNAFTCSWYVSTTYHSPVNFHVNSTYCIRSTPVYWSRLGRSCYRTDTYLPSSYSGLGVHFCSVRVPSLPIWWRQ